MKTALAIIATAFFLYGCEVRQPQPEAGKPQGECFRVTDVLSLFSKFISDTLRVAYTEDLAYVDSLILAHCSGANSTSDDCRGLLVRQAHLRRRINSSEVDPDDRRNPSMRSLFHRTLPDTMCIDRPVLWLTRAHIFPTRLSFSHEPQNRVFAIAIENDSGYTSYCYDYVRRFYLGRTEIRKSSIDPAYQTLMAEPTCPDSATSGNRVRWVKISRHEIAVGDEKFPCNDQLAVIDSIFFPQLSLSQSALIEGGAILDSR